MRDEENMKHLENNNNSVGGFISRASLLLVRNTLFVVALLFGATALLLFNAIPASPEGQSLVYTTADYEGRKTEEKRRAPLFKEAFDKKKNGGVSGGWGTAIGDDF